MQSCSVRVDAVHCLGGYSRYNMYDYLLEV